MITMDHNIIKDHSIITDRNIATDRRIYKKSLVEKVEVQRLVTEMKIEVGLGMGL